LKNVNSNDDDVKRASNLKRAIKKKRIFPVKSKVKYGKEICLMIAIATDGILRFYFSGAVPQENVFNEEDQVSFHLMIVTIVVN